MGLMRSEFWVHTGTVQVISKICKIVGLFRSVFLFLFLLKQNLHLQLVGGAVLFWIV